MILSAFRFLPFFVLSFIVLCGSAMAQSISCPQLKEDTSYKNGMKAYRYLVEGQDGWLFRSSTDIKEDFSMTSKTLDHFKKLNEALSDKGIDLYVVGIPTRGIVNFDKFPTQSEFLSAYHHDKAISSYADFVTDLNAAGLPVAGYEFENDSNLEFFHARDHHWAAPGGRRMAERIAGMIQRKHKELPERKYISEKLPETKEFAGTFEKFVEEICNIQIEDEKIEVFKTYVEESGETSLFDDARSAQVAVIGSSNSTEPGPSYANFTGFLRESLSADVDNVSISGGGVVTPILAYMASDDYATKKHKVLVWEIPTYYNLNGQKFDSLFRQVIPAVYGFCDKNALVESRYSLSAEEGPVFPALVEAALPALSTYLAIRFDKPVKKNFDLNVEYTDGDSEVFRFERPERYPHDGAYFLSFEGKKSQLLANISILPEEGFEATSLLGQICSY